MKIAKNLSIILLALTVSSIAAGPKNYKKAALRILKKEGKGLKKVAKIYKHAKVNASTRKLLKRYTTNTEIITSLTKHMFALEKTDSQQLNTVQSALLEKKAENQTILLNIFKSSF